MKKQVFNYIDALPGAGKTEYFVNLAERHIRQRRGHILIYVAPTRRLLTETFARLLARDVSMRNVFMVMDNGAETFPADLADHGRWLRDAPATALNYLLGLITRATYVGAPYPERYKKDCTRALTDGDIVFTTHAAFLRVQAKDLTGNDFKILRRCHVVFDEARNCVLSSKAFSLSSADWQSLTRSMKFRQVESNGGWTVSEITDMAETAELKKNFKATTLARLPAPVRELKEQYDNYVRVGRASIFTLSKSLATEKNAVSLHMTLRPISLFEHYGRVTLVSAFLTDSQMYHFLKRDGHTFVDLLARPIPKSHLLAPILERHRRLKENVSRRLQVAPLLQPTTDALRDNLTSHLLQSKLVVPADFNELSSHEDQENLDYIPSAYRAPPLWVLIRAAARVFTRWRRDHDHAELALLTLNASGAPRRWMGRIRYLAVVQSILRYGYVHQDPDENYEEVESYLTTDELRDVNETSPAWTKFLRRALFVRSDERVFTTPKSPSLYGVNSYSNYYAFVHLAALNPTPNLMRFYNILLGEYDVDLDHSIDNLVQMLYRTNLRDPAGRKPVLLITAYASVAHMLATKLGVAPFREVHVPELKSWAHKTTQVKARHAESSRRGGTNSRKYAKEFVPQIQKLKAYIRRTAKLDPTPKRLANLATWAHQLRELEQKARTKP